MLESRRYNRDCPPFSPAVSNLVRSECTPSRNICDCASLLPVKRRLCEHERKSYITQLTRLICVVWSNVHKGASEHSYVFKAFIAPTWSITPSLKTLKRHKTTSATFYLSAASLNFPYMLTNNGSNSYTCRIQEKLCWGNFFSCMLPDAIVPSKTI